MSSTPLKVEALRLRIENGESSLSEVDLSSCALTTFPLELLWPLRDTLEVLNLGGNGISSLPDEIRWFGRLRILFFAGNRFTSVPPVLGCLPSLYMLSFKSNCLEEVPEESLSPRLGWLILTDNKIKRLPRSIGALSGLRKCMLAANELTELPDEMQNCRELELLRIAANKLSALPDWLLQLPKLSWLAFAGNPCSSIFTSSQGESELPTIQHAELQLGDKLGEGASGVVYKATWHAPVDGTVFGGGSSRGDGQEHEVAVKLFKSGATSDGLPEDEMRAMAAAGSHPYCAGVLGRLVGSPSGELGLVLPLLPPSFKILGNPPSFHTVTRDTFPTGTTFGLRAVLRILHGIAAVCAHLHSKNIMHGDLYCHNVLVDPSHSPVLSDFGAASFYAASAVHKESESSLAGEQEDKQSGLSSSSSLAVQADLERIESRAFGCLAEDLLQYIELAESDADTSLRQRLFAMVQRCMAQVVRERPLFWELLAELELEVAVHQGVNY